MTKEELKQEAEEWLCNNLHSASEEDFIKAMVDIAMPREERIKEPETQVKTAYRKGMRHMAKALKDYDRTDGAWTDYFEHTVDKVLQREQVDFEEYGNLADQLTKAKDLLKRCYENYIYLEPLRSEIEQFLNSEVEK
jgi:hypothetical protein